MAAIAPGLDRGSPGAARHGGPLATIAVLAVLGVVVFGGYVTAAALSEPAGPPVTLAGVVRIAPLSGWQVAGRFSGPPGVRFTRGTANLAVFVVPFRGSPEELVAAFVRQVLEPDAERLQVSRRVETVQVAGGRTGVRIAYVGLFRGVQYQIEGQVTGVVSSSSDAGVVFDGWAPAGLLQYVSGDIDAMIAAARVR